MSIKSEKFDSEIVVKSEEISSSNVNNQRSLQSMDQIKHENLIERTSIKKDKSFEFTTNYKEFFQQPIKEENPLEISETITINQRNLPSYEFSSNHPTSSTPSSIYNCSTCNETFDYKSSLIRHEMTHIEKVKCKKCSQNVFKHMLEEHEKAHESQKDLQCEVCERIFSEKSAKNRHMLTHSDIKLYTCSICQKGFNDRRHFHNHEKIHENPRPFKCDECSSSFNRKSNLSEHKRRIHAKNNSIHYCQHCDFSTSNYTAFITHKMKHREKQKCPHCDKSFPEAGKLKIHILAVHVKSYEFKCDICDEAFTTDLYVKRHKKDKHPDSVIKYKCPDCNKFFTSEANLSNHKTKYHSVKMS